MTNILLAIFVLEFGIFLYLKRRTIMTQQEAHDTLLTKIGEVSQAVNAASQRQAAAIEAATGKATVDDTDLNAALDNIKSTADNIAPTPAPEPTV